MSSHTLHIRSVVLFIRFLFVYHASNRDSHDSYLTGFKESKVKYYLTEMVKSMPHYTITTSK